jgi:predicted RNA-binding protein with PIN domain
VAPALAPPVRRGVAPGPTAQRQPAPLPPAVFDDSPEAAEHLVRTRGMVLIVDGYNVSKWGWAELPLPEQRRRLVDALAELAARTGVDAQVVFDGSDVVMPPAVPTTARSVRVSFSPPGVEADDVVIERVAQLPVHRPVLVASNDRRVRQGASRHGANVISTEQLMAVLRR